MKQCIGGGGSATRVLRCNWLTDFDPGSEAELQVALPSPGWETSAPGRRVTCSDCGRNVFALGAQNHDGFRPEADISVFKTTFDV